jgi:N-acetylglucosaminyl-diphospho-decaprenol L-rhamnosyltransferase
VKLSIVILCWNDLRVISDCLRSIYEETCDIDFEVIVADNGSTDGALDFIRKSYPAVRIVENGGNIGFAAGNNAGIGVSTGDYVLVLNPDTIIRERALQTWIAFADRHAEAGAFGCKVLNRDGSYQSPARPFPTVWRSWISALYLRSLGRFSEAFVSEAYAGWEGDGERTIDWQSGCCILFRADVLKDLGGFDPQFFYHFEEVDLCRRVWDAGYSILYTPEPVITHLGGQSVNRFPVRFELEKYRSRYRYFYKHFGSAAARRCRQTVLTRIAVRQIGWRLAALFAPSEEMQSRLEMYRVTAEWNRKIDPIRFVQNGEEPDVMQPKPAPASSMLGA